MRAVVQRVAHASVTVDGERVGACARGLLVLVGARHEDTSETARRLAGKIARLRIFENDVGRFDRSLLDVAGEALVVSQFTLLADTTKGNRPSFTGAAPPEVAEPLVAEVVDELRALGITTATGRFGAQMAVEIVNDGPVTVLLDVALAGDVTARQRKYADQARTLAEIGAVLIASSLPQTEVRLPRSLAEAAIAAWDWDDDEPLQDETPEHSIARRRAGALALLGHAISEHGRPDGPEAVVVALDPGLIGDAVDAADELPAAE